MKKFLSVVLTISMLMMLGTSVSCAEIDPGTIPAPCWAYMSAIDIDINFSGTEGTATLTVNRINNVTTSIEATFTVYELIGHEWVEVASDTDSSTRSLWMEVLFDAEVGGYYMAVAEVTAYSGSRSETETISHTREYE